MLVIAGCDGRTRRRAVPGVRSARFPRLKRQKELSFDANRHHPRVCPPVRTWSWCKAIHPEFLTGHSGPGDSHLLIAFGAMAAEAGYRVRYTLVSKLLTSWSKPPTTSIWPN